jgi:putative ABC transport system substrate-binding protein
VAARGTRTAVGDAGNWVPRRWILSVAAFRKGLGETGYVEGRNVTVEYHGLGGQYDRLPVLMEDLVRRRGALIATPGATAASIAAKAAFPSAPTRSQWVLSPASPGPARTSPALPI